jgi:hypothetical protein
MPDQTKRAAEYFRGHRRVSRLDLWTYGVLRPDREVKRLQESGWDIIPFTSGEDLDDPRLSGWLVVAQPVVSVEISASQGTPRTIWRCTKTDRVKREERWVKEPCELEGVPDMYTMLDEKARYTTGSCPKHGRPVMLTSDDAAAPGLRAAPATDPARVQRPVLASEDEQQEGGRDREGYQRHV